jgi:DNA-binding CsgD family transcriptional regulator
MLAGMSRDAMKQMLGYGALAALLLVCLRLVSLAPLAIDWGRELVAAAIAVVALLIGLRFATRGERPRTEPVRTTTDEGAEARPAASPVDSPLSPREQHVLALLARGLSNKELARELGVSANTVKTHLANVYEKLGARRRTEAIAAARRLGLIG